MDKDNSRFVSRRQTRNLQSQPRHEIRTWLVEYCACALDLVFDKTGMYEVTPRSHFTYLKLISNCYVSYNYICFACVYAILQCNEL